MLCTRELDRITVRNRFYDFRAVVQAAQRRAEEERSARQERDTAARRAADTELSLSVCRL